ncbi:hypothetical protein BDR07DRAFT_1490662 [Suillus spraguei]|nr:hypothetical protein BDR07DRAFT_1490662 [Suillus spraguei]
MSDPQKMVQGRSRGQVRGTRGTRGATRGGCTNPNYITNAASVNIPATTDTTTAAPSTDPAVSILPSKFTIKWESGHIDHTFLLIAYLMAHHADCHILFSENKKKNQTMQDDESGMQPSSIEKGRIHAIIAQEIFANVVYYNTYYKAYPQKFAVTVANWLTL